MKKNLKKINVKNIVTTPRFKLDFYTFNTKLFYTTHFYTCVKLVFHKGLLHITIPAGN